MRRFLLICLVGITAVAFVGCGDDDDDDDTSAGTSSTTASTTSTTEPDTTSTTAGAAGDVNVKVASTDLGDILVDAEGRTLYGFKNDSAGTPTCTGGCASTWPPATVDGSPQVDAAIGQGTITTVEAGGASQLKAGSWPLYRYAQDSAPGDTNGQGVGGVWFTVRPDGSLNESG